MFIKLGSNLEERGGWDQCTSMCSDIQNAQRRGKRSAENIEKRWWDDYESYYYDDDYDGYDDYQYDDDWIDKEIDKIKENIFWSFPKWMRDEFCDRCKDYCLETWRECCDF